MFDALLSISGLSLLLSSHSSISTSLNLLFFYLTWTTLLFSHPPLRIELFGTAIIRVLFFWAPTLLFLAFDVALPSISKAVKLQGSRSLRASRSMTTANGLSASAVRNAASGLTSLNGIRSKSRELSGTLAAQRLKTMTWALVNTFVSLGVQALVETVLVDFFKVRSALRIAKSLPMPGELAWDLLRGFIIREILQYYVARFALHGYLRGRFSGWVGRTHLRWAHSVRAPWSAVAHYDHPVPYVLGRFLPCYIPAVLFRFHLLTWFLFIALTCIEEVTTYSGYTNVYSLLGGATRRIDMHFECGGKGNYSSWGLLDWIHGTSIARGDDDYGDGAIERVSREVDKASTSGSSRRKPSRARKTTSGRGRKSGRESSSD